MGPSNMAPVRVQERLPRRRALRDRRQAGRFEDPPNRQAAHAVADVLQRALDPRVAPRRILLSHADDQSPDLEQHAASGSSAVRPFPRDQLTMPAQQGVRRRDRGHLTQGRTTDSVRSGGQSTAIVITEAQSLLPELAPQEPVLFD
jgi:hypothetical protein